MTDYALFHHGKQVSKAHSNRIAAQMEAYEFGVVLDSAIGDFPGDSPSVRRLATGYEVKEVDE